MSEIYNNNYYLVVSGPTWNDAESNAINLGGHLVSVNSQAENKTLFTEMTGFG